MKIPLRLYPSNSALLLDIVGSRTNSFSSSCVRVCVCGAEDVPWETCGSESPAAQGNRSSTCLRPRRLNGW